MIKNSIFPLSLVGALASVALVLPSQAFAEIVELKYSGTITTAEDYGKVDRAFLLPEDASDEKSLIGTTVTGRILIDTDRLPSDRYKNVENRSYYSESPTSYLTMSFTIEETGQSFGINQVDYLSSETSKVVFGDLLNYENDYGRDVDDALSIGKSNKFTRYENGTEVSYKNMKLRINANNQHFTNSAKITDPIHAFISSDSTVSSFTVSENYNMGAYEKNGKISFSINQIDSVEICE